MTDQVRRRYQRPPLLEAVAEFRFAPDSPWDTTVPGLIYDRLKNAFPKKEQVMALDAAIQAESNTFQPVERLRLTREDERALLHLNANYLSVSRLEPYESWEEFKPLIDEAVATYRDVANPAGIQRVGLRYVNRVVIPVEEFDLANYFAFYPHLGEQLPSQHGPFICGVQFAYEEGRDAVRMQLADSPNDGDNAAFVLDIDYFLAVAGETAFEEVDTWLETAHGRIEELFEGSITDALREQFEELDQS